MNNIVDAVNQNSTNAIQAAVLARLFGGAQANPVIGGVNQAEPPAQDFVSNAMNNPKPTVMPQLAGAKGEVSGRGGAMGGIGDALMNMYNSRIARSENEVKFAQEAEQAKKQEEAAVKRFAAEQGIKLKTEKEVLAYKEGLDSSVAETQRTKAQTANILSEMARRDKTPIGGSGRGSSGGETNGQPITGTEVPQPPEDLKVLQTHWSNIINNPKTPKTQLAMAKTRYAHVTKMISDNEKEMDNNYKSYLDVLNKMDEVDPKSEAYSVLSDRKAILEARLGKSKPKQDNVDDFLTGNPPANKPQQPVAPQEKKYSGEIPTNGGAEVIPVPSTPQGAPRQLTIADRLMDRFGNFVGNVGDAVKDLPGISEVRLARAQSKLRNGQPLSAEEQEMINKYGGGR